MTKRMTAVLLIAIGILVTLVSISIVSATHYGTTKHWHSEEAEYKLLTDELPDSWEDENPGALLRDGMTDQSSPSPKIHRPTISSNAALFLALGSAKVVTFRA